MKGLQGRAGREVIHVFVLVSAGDIRESGVEVGKEVLNIPQAVNEEDGIIIGKDADDVKENCLAVVSSNAENETKKEVCFSRVLRKGEGFWYDLTDPKREEGTQNITSLLENYIASKSGSKGLREVEGPL